MLLLLMDGWVCVRQTEEEQLRMEKSSTVDEFW